MKHATRRHYLNHNDGREILAHVWGYLLLQRAAHRRELHFPWHACPVCRDLDLATHLVLGVAVEEFGVDLNELRWLASQNFPSKGELLIRDYLEAFGGAA